MGTLDDSQDQNRTLFRSICARSLWSMLLVTGTIFVIGLLPRTHFENMEMVDDTVREKFDGVEAKLRHLLVLHRHGARTPIAWFSFEGAWAWEQQELAQGKLTVAGMQEGFKLGQMLRREYGSEITVPVHGRQNAVPEDRLTVVSTDVDRTVDTVRSLLLGLYSPVGTETTRVDKCACRPNYGTRSEPMCIAECLSLSNPPATPEVVVRDSLKDKEMQQFRLCQGWNEWRSQMETEEEWTSQEDHFSTATKTVKNIVPKVFERLEWPGGDEERRVDTTKSDFDFVSFMDAVWSNSVCYQFDDLKYTESMSNKEFREIMDPVADYVWHTRYGIKHGPQAGGILLNAWMDKMNATIAEMTSSSSSPGAPKVEIYSAHDTTVFALMAAMGASVPVHIPRFASHIVVELWQPEGVNGGDDFQVRMRYDGELMPVAAGCDGGKCTWGELFKGTRDRVMTEDDCKPY